VLNTIMFNYTQHHNVQFSVINDDDDDGGSGGGGGGGDDDDDYDDDNIGYLAGKE